MLLIRKFGVTNENYICFTVDASDLETQRETLTELSYYQLAAKGMDVEVPILVIDDEDDPWLAEKYHGQDVITKLKEMV